MDKFGIFELLDTLSELATDRVENEVPPPEANPLRPSPDDKSFLPPDLNGNPLSEEQQLQRNALNALYERHESVIKRIDKKK